MPHCVVIADDVTGANATGVLLKKQGFETMTLLRESRSKANSLKACDCLVMSTDSRALCPGEAYERVKEALCLMRSKNVLLYSKRVDSTLRGNLGSETDAFLDLLGEDALAVCVPVFPASGRVLLGSHLLVNGVALRCSEAAKDPKCPVHATDALQILRGQTKRRVESIHLDHISDGAPHLKTVIQDFYQKGVRILLLDSVCEEDMETIAEALKGASFPIVAVDPGPFTAIMLKRLAPPTLLKKGSKVICAIGSVNGVAAAQTLRLLSELPARAVLMDVECILQGDAARQAEIDRAVKALLAKRKESDLLALIGSGIDPAKKLPLGEWAQRRGISVDDLSETINDAFAEVILRVMAEERRIRGLYSTGGDITAAIHRRAGTVALRLLEEVLPLAAFAQVIGGEMDAMYCISKGGMVGDEGAMVRCVSYLQNQLADKFHDSEKG